MNVLLTVAAAAYLHANPEAFTGAYTLSIIMWFALILWVVFAVLAVFAESTR